MSAVHTFVEVALDAWLAPLGGLPSWLGLVALALPTTLGVLVLFKWTTNQDRLAETKRRMHAGLLELRLFNDDLSAIGRTALDLVGHSVAYVRLSLVPLAVALVPLTVLLAHTHARYAYAGLQTGESAVLTVRVSDGIGGGPQRPALDLRVPPGLRVDTAAAWVRSLREASWRLTALRRGDYSVRATVEGFEADKRVMVSSGPVPRATTRVKRGMFGGLASPVEPLLPPQGPIDQIAVTYAASRVSILGFEAAWWAVFFVACVCWALIFRRVMGVVV